MALKGNLRDFNTAQLLNLIHLAQKTGQLIVNGQSHKATLFFKEGRLIHASTSAAEGQLAAMLLKKGQLTPLQTETLTRQIGISERGLGQFLLETRLMSKADIVQSVKDYMLGIVHNLFTWAEGEFWFEQNLLPAGHRITLPLNLDNVILECNRRSQETDRLLAELPDLGTIRLKITDKPLYDIKLTQDDWRVISHINPHHSIKQIAQENNMGEFQIRRIVFGMLQVGLIEIVPPEGPKQKAATIPAVQPDRPTDSQSLGDKRRLVMRIINRISRSMNSGIAKVTYKSAVASSHAANVEMMGRGV